MKRLLSVVPLMACGALVFWPASGARAQSIPYPDAGTVNPVEYSFTATSTGDLVAYDFAQSGASFDEQLGLLVNGVDTGINGLDDHNSQEGDPLNFGMVHAGDVLTFYINVETGGQGNFTYYSNTALNNDGLNHVYSALWAGGLPPGGTVALPAGIYLGFEDASPVNNGFSDFNYQDEQFVFTDTSVSVVPEPATWLGLLTGLGGLATLRANKLGANKLRANKRPRFSVS